MSTSERHVALITENSEAEIQLVGSEFKVLARGPSPLKATVPVGVYGAKVLIGDRETQSLLLVEEGEGELEHHIDSPRIESPLPLHEASTEIGTGDLRQLSDRLHNRLADAEAGVHVCFRYPEASSAGVAIAVGSQEFHDLQDRIRLVDSTAPVPPAQATWPHNTRASISLVFDVAPGNCTLFYRQDKEEMGIPLPACAGWVIQAFIPMVASAGTYTPDFREMSVFYSRPGANQSQGKAELRVAETVRQSMGRGRTHISGEVLQSLLTGKLDNPMLGIYAAHHLLKDSGAANILPTVLLNTAHLLGENHPDVVALECAVFCHQSLETRQARLARLQGPPLLSDSWDLLVAEANDLPFGTVKDNRAFAIGPSLCMQGIFVAWWHRQGDAASPPSAPAPASTARTDAAPAPAPRIGEPTAARFDATTPPKPVPVRRSKFDLHEAVRLTSLGVTNLVLKIRDKISGSVTHAVSPSEGEGEAASAIELIDSLDSAARAIQALAREFDWDMLTLEIRSNHAWLAALSPLQKSLVMSLRDIKLSDGEDITADYVDRLLKAHRVPLETLIQDLRQLELGGWAVEQIDEILDSAARSTSGKLARALDRFRT